MKTRIEMEKDAVIWLSGNSIHRRDLVVQAGTYTKYRGIGNVDMEKDAMNVLERTYFLKHCVEVHNILGNMTNSWQQKFEFFEIVCSPCSADITDFLGR